jgi:hypothetical protein
MEKEQTMKPIINGGGGNECDAATLDLLSAASLKTKPFDLNGRSLTVRALKIFVFL